MATCLKLKTDVKSRKIITTLGQSKQCSIMQKKKKVVDLSLL